MDAADPSRRTEAELLGLAVLLARNNAAQGQGPFAAVVARHGVVLATGVNTTLRDDDPLAHAEATAIRRACQTLGSLTLRDATLVASCEPCLMCHAAALLVGVARVIYAAPKEYAADVGFGLLPAAADMQDAMRHTGVLSPEFITIDGARSPFSSFVALRKLTEGDASEVRLQDSDYRRGNSSVR